MCDVATLAGATPVGMNIAAKPKARQENDVCQGSPRSGRSPISIKRCRHRSPPQQSVTNVDISKEVEHRKPRAKQHQHHIKKNWSSIVVKAHHCWMKVSPQRNHNKFSSWRPRSRMVNYIEVTLAPSSPRTHGAKARPRYKNRKHENSRPEDRGIDTRHRPRKKANQPRPLTPLLVDAQVKVHSPQGCPDQDRQRWTR